MWIRRGARGRSPPARQAGTWVFEMITVQRDRERSVLNTMRGLVSIDENMCHKKRMPHNNASSVPGQPTKPAFSMAHEASVNLFGRDTGQRKFFQSDKTVSGALSDVLNPDVMNEITTCAHSQLKLLLFLSFATPSLS